MYLLFIFSFQEHWVNVDKKTKECILKKVAVNQPVTTT